MNIQSIETYQVRLPLKRRLSRAMVAWKKKRLIYL